MKPKLLIASLATVSVLGGVAVGATVFAPGSSSAASRASAPAAQLSAAAFGAKHGLRGQHAQELLDAAAKALGISSDELRTDLQNRQTVAQVAQSKNVPVQTVIDALVADANAQIDKALADQKITQERADDMKSKVTERVTDFVNGTGKPWDRFERRMDRLDAAAKSLGLTVEQLQAELKSGKTLAQVAQDKNVPVQTVIDALVADANAQIDQALADKKVTQQQADDMKSKVTERVTAMVNGQKPDGPAGRGDRGGHGPHGHGARGPALDSAAKALNMSPDDLKTALRNGQTIAQIAQAKNVNVQDVINAMIADANARIDQGVKDGKLTEDQATKMKAKVTERVTNFVNGVRPAGAPAPDGDGPDGAGPGPDGPQGGGFN